ncbi:MAG: hypothetical protein ACLVJH_18760 [Faecalibacterium prausnitzii]
MEQAVQLGDIRLNLFDTAGLRETEDAIEAEGIRRSWKKLDEAGLILAVFDGSEPPDPGGSWRWRSAALVARPSHWSTRRTSPPGLTQSSSPPILPWCCRSAARKREPQQVIAAAVARLLGTSSIDLTPPACPGSGSFLLPLRARDAVAGALDAAAGGFGLDAVSVCVDDALDALCDLTGENASEAVIEQVFERFCVERCSGEFNSSQD